MLQRVQTIYLILVVLCVTVLLFLPLASLQKELVEVFEEGAVDITVFGMSIKFVGVQYTSNIVLSSLSVLAIFIPLITIMLYKRRPLQITLMVAEIVLLLGISGMIVYQVGALIKAIKGSAFEGVLKFNILPHVVIGFAILFTIIAIGYIKKDEKLIKDSYRFR